MKKQRSVHSGRCFLCLPSNSAFAFHFLTMAETPNNHHNTDDNKGDTKPLPHVEGHVAFEVDLHILQELNGNTRAEDNDEERAKHQTRLLVTKVALVVHP